jgi:alpha-methylacyl-CoA racemase
MQPLSGVSVLDLSRLLPGPFASWWLASLGAEVLRVESPQLGDYARGFPPYVGGQGALFHVVNRGKRSLGLDLKQEAGRDILLRLAERHDVLLEPFRPGVLERLGLGPDVLHARNARLVICRLTGYGQQGPLAADAGHDLNYQALAGTLAMAGSSGPPPTPAIPTADLVGGLTAVIAIQGALLARERTGRGAVLDVALADALAALAAPMLATWTGGGLERGQHVLNGSIAQYRVYECKDGGWLAVGALEPKFWARFAAVAGHPEWAAHPAFPGDFQDALVAEVTAVVASKTRVEWEQALQGVDCCVTPVLRPREAMAHPHWQARGAAGQAESSGGPAGWVEVAPGVLGDAPTLGQHSDEVLRELGLEDRIAELRAASVVV